MRRTDVSHGCVAQRWCVIWTRVRRRARTFVRHPLGGHPWATPRCAQMGASQVSHLVCRTCVACGVPRMGCTEAYGPSRTVRGAARVSHGLLPHVRRADSCRSCVARMRAAHASHRCVPRMCRTGYAMFGPRGLAPHMCRAMRTALVSRLGVPRALCTGPGESSLVG